MNKRILPLLAVLLLSSISIGCSKPPYDAKGINQSELDSPAQKERTTPAAGGGSALSEKNW